MGRSQKIGSAILLTMLLLQVFAALSQTTSTDSGASDTDSPEYLEDGFPLGSVTDDLPSSLLEGYSSDVQKAFAVSSDLERYEPEQLNAIRSWVVVTKMGVENQLKSTGSPDEVEIAPVLMGAYIWSFDDPSLALDSLARAIKIGDIEIYYPLILYEAQPAYTPNDPDYGDQWHLDNTGQSGGTSGEDVNISGVWDNYDGSGVVISIIDDGLQKDHPDLSTNFDLSLSYDRCGDGGTDPSPQASDENHGTAVAGVAAATGDNSVNVAGAAYGATLSGQRLIACGIPDTVMAATL
ncbi:uncharacterized protein METZ01_LOCUS238577, partial [marine metagenome]